MKLSEVQDNYCIKEYGHYFNQSVFRNKVTEEDRITMTKLYAKAKLEEAAMNLHKFRAGDHNTVAITFNTAIEIAQHSIIETPLD